MAAVEEFMALAALPDHFACRRAIFDASTKIR